MESTCTAVLDQCGRDKNKQPTTNKGAKKPESEESKMQIPPTPPITRHRVPHASFTAKGLKITIQWIPAFL